MKFTRFVAMAGLTATLAAGALFGAETPAAAVVYCKTVGVPKGCVARPTHAVVYCKRVGYPKGCVMR